MTVYVVWAQQGQAAEVDSVWNTEDAARARVERCLEAIRQRPSPWRGPWTFTYEDRTLNTPGSWSLDGPPPDPLAG